MLTNPPQFCPGGEECPKCGTNKCACPSSPPPNSGDEFCNPTLDNPPQLCPGGLPCPDCGTVRCKCEDNPPPEPVNPHGDNDAKCEMSTETDCGYEGIDESECQAKGCCWKPDVPKGTPWCVYPADPNPNGGEEFCDPMLTNPPQFCPGGQECPKCGTNKCACPSSPGPNNGEEFCNPTLTNPPQFCPGGAPCPDCGTVRCSCGESPSPNKGGDEFCNPTLDNPPQLCPGGLPCPDCGTVRCQCPSHKSNSTSVMV